MYLIKNMGYTAIYAKISTNDSSVNPFTVAASGEDVTLTSAYGLYGCIIAP